MPTYPYQTVAETIRQRILDGTYPPGSKLPTRKQLAEDFGLSDIVIGAAMRLLKHDGLIDSLPGVGVYVAEQAQP